MKIYEINNGFARHLRSRDNPRLIPFIQKNCSDFLDVAGKRKLYHGVHSRPSIFFGRTMNDRRPQATDPEIAKLIDLKLSEAGFTAIRSNSIFCSGDSLLTSNFGPTYCIFPINGFSFTWSRKIRDFTIDTGLSSSGLKYHKEGDISHRNWKNWSPQEKLTQTLFDKKTLRKIANNLKNITLNGKAFAHEYQFSDTDIIEAIASGNEILIHGSYIAIETGMPILHEIY